MPSNAQSTEALVNIVFSVLMALQGPDFITCARPGAE
jgi:hypothetical protein